MFIKFECGGCGKVYENEVIANTCCADEGINEVSACCHAEFSPMTKTDRHKIGGRGDRYEFAESSVEEIVCEKCLCSVE